ncbi:hypothetical protein GW17_00005212 [Ensete ventricosum]|nr:hypothetical protein GW17_00005212 [Ensete ventricosum]
MHHRAAGRSPSDPNRMAAELPLVVSLNCLEDPSLEREALAGSAAVEYVGLPGLSSGRIESATAVLIHSLALLPRAAQRRLRPWQLILCLGSPDRAVDSALAADLGLRLVHVDANRAEEVADTVMALFLGLLRRTHLLSSHSSSSSAASGWLGSIQPLCRGMRRCRGLVLGIIGRSASARCLATRSLAFRMSVLYFDLHHEVREMPNVLILPRSADYSEEVWMEIREKAITILQSFIFEGVVPEIAVSDEDDMSEAGYEDVQSEKRVKESPFQVQDCEQQTDESHLSSEYTKTKGIQQFKESQGSGISQNTGSRSEGRRSRSGRKGKKRPARRRSQQKSDDFSAVESDTNYNSHRGDDTAVSGRDQLLSSSSRFASPEDPKSKQMCLFEPMMESKSGKQVALSTELNSKSPDWLKDGFIVALHARGNSGFHVARQKVPGGGWFLDTVTNVTKRDPAAQFVVAFKSKVVSEMFNIVLLIHLCVNFSPSGYRNELSFSTAIYPGHTRIAIFCCWG